jgi:hypothetical protein
MEARWCLIRFRFWWSRSSRTMRPVILARQHNLPRAALLCHGVHLARITEWQSLTDGQYKFPIPDVIGKFPHFRCIRARSRE